MLFYIFFKKDFFRAVLDTNKIEERVEISYIAPAPTHTELPLSTFGIFGPFVTIDEPMLTHHNHPKSMVYIN